MQFALSCIPRKYSAVSSEDQDLFDWYFKTFAGRQTTKNSRQYDKGCWTLELWLVRSACGKLQRPQLTLPLKAEQENPQWSKVAFNLVLNSKQTGQTSLGISVINCPLFSAKLARKLDDPSPAALSRGWWTFMVGRRTSSTVPKNSHLGWDSPPKPT